MQPAVQLKVHLLVQLVVQPLVKLKGQPKWQPNVQPLVELVVQPKVQLVLQPCFRSLTEVVHFSQHLFIECSENINYVIIHRPHMASHA